MGETKLTKRVLVGKLKELVEGVDVEYKAELLEFLDKEDKALVRKASKPTKAQLANEPLKEAVLAVLAKSDKPLGVKEIQVADEAFAGLSNQKVTSLVTALVKAGRIVKTEDKKKALYSVVAE